MTTASKTSKPKNRAIAVVLPFTPASEEPAIIRITEGVRVLHVDEYFVDKIPSAWGVAYRVEKRDYKPGEEPQVYHVCLDGILSSCECKGFLFAHHCRHIETLQALKDAGEL